MQKFLYKFNNFLLVLITFLLIGVFWGHYNDVKSREDLFKKYFSEDSLNNAGLKGSSISFINKTLKVDQTVNEFKAEFISDGYTGDCSKTEGRCETFGDNISTGKGFGLLAPVTIKYGDAKIERLGTISYASVPKATAPINTVCDDNNGLQLQNENCYFNITGVAYDAAHRYSKALEDLSQNPTKTVNNVTGNNVVSSISSTIENIFSKDKQILGTSINYYASGVHSEDAWSNSDGCQICKTNGKLVPTYVRSVYTVGNPYQYLNSNLSTTLNAKIIYDQFNNPTFNKERTDLLSADGKYFGFGKRMGDQYTKLKPENYKPSDDFLQNIFNTAKAMVELVLTDVSTQGYTKIQNQQNLVGVVPIRPLVDEEEKINYSFQFCPAARAGYEAAKTSRQEGDPPVQDVTPLPNPFIENKAKYDQYIAEGRMTLAELTQYTTAYDSLSADVKWCLGAMGINILGTNNVDGISGYDHAVNCAEYSAGFNNGTHCEEFSVEDSGSFSERTPVIGYQQNVQTYAETMQFSSLSSSSTPFINSTSISLCDLYSRMISITPGASYVYKAQSSKSGTNFLQKFCVVGGRLSHEDWISYNYMVNFLSTTPGSGKFKFPKASLTCDKNEKPYFSGTPLQANIQKPGDKLIYGKRDIKNEDGTGLITKDDFVVMWGQDEISIRDCVAETNTSMFVYKDFEAKVVVVNGRPQYVLYITQEENKKLILCKISNGQKKLGEKSTVVLSKYDSKIKDEKSFGLVGDISVQNCGNRICITHVYFDKSTTDSIVYADGYSVNLGDINDTKVSTIKLQPDNNKYVYQALTLDNGNAGIILSSKNSLYYFEINAESGEPKVVFRSGNLCDTGDGVCNLMSKQHTPIFKLAQEGSTVLVVATGSGVGTVFPVKGSFGTGPAGLQNYYIFSYTMRDQVYSINNDYASYVLLKGGNLVVAMELSGSILFLRQPGAYGDQNLVKKVYTEGGDNALIVEKYVRDPRTFYYDCTNELGLVGKNANCGDDEYTSKLGPISIFYMEYGKSGGLDICYRFKKSLKQSFFCAEDVLEYTYTGGYLPVDGSNIEYSNGYFAKSGSLEPVTVRIKNVQNGGLKLGSHLEKTTGGVIREILGAFNKFKKASCQKFLDNNIEDIDPYLDQYDLENTSFANKKYQIAPTTDGSNKNNGLYCDETWCVPNDYMLVGNDDFNINKGLSAGEQDEVIDKLSSFMAKRYGTTKETYLPKMTQLCTQGAQYGIHCGLLVATWIQESSGRLDDNIKNGALGCQGSGKKGQEGYLFCNEKGPGGSINPNYSAEKCANWEGFDAQVECSTKMALFSAFTYYQKGQRKIESNIKTKNPIPRTCEAGTFFSFLFERYTPMTSHYENNCNHGLLVRSDMFSKCNMENYKEINGSTNPDDWPYGKILTKEEAQNIANGIDCNNIPLSGETEIKNKCNFDKLNKSVGYEYYGTRVNLRVIFEKINKEVFPTGKFSIPITDKCYPTTSENVTSPIPDQKDATSTIATTILDPVKGNPEIGQPWGATAGATGVFQITFDMLAEKNKSPNPNQVSFTIPKGKKFSLLDSFQMNKTYENGITQIDAERFVSEFTSKYNLPQYSAYDFSQSQDPGSGMCEFTTAIKNTVADIKSNAGTAVFVRGAPEDSNSLKKHYATGPIQYYSHIGVGAKDYNRLVVSGSKISSSDDFISIWIVPPAPLLGGLQDLIIQNDNNDDLVITISRNPSNKYEFTYNAFMKKPSTTTPDQNVVQHPYLDLEVGKGNPIPDAANFTPPSLASLEVEPASSTWNEDSSNKGIALKPIQVYSHMISDLEQMIKAAEEAGFKNGTRLHVISGYRSYADQARVKEGNSDDSVAKPGESEHQLGTAIDIMPRNYDIGDDAKINKFIQEDPNKFIPWIKANAAKYNFYMTYDEGNNKGFRYEPWHLRWKPKSNFTFNNKLNTLQSIAYKKEELY